MHRQSSDLSRRCALFHRSGSPASADETLEPPGADFLLSGHEALPAFLLDVVGHLICLVIGLSSFDVFLLEATDSVDLGHLQPLQQEFEVRFYPPGKPTMKAGQIARSAQILRQL